MRNGHGFAGADDSIRGLVIDWGGVLTTPLGTMVAAWLAAERIDDASYRAVMREWVIEAYATSGRGNPVQRLERGELDPAEFERALAARLRRVDGTPIEPTGLLARMFSAAGTDELMWSAVRAARAAGLRTCLLSNSWGNSYDRTGWAEVFDAVVISGEVGMRKPEEEIFHHASGLIGLPPAQCVFVDDVEPNVTAARALGFAGIHHSEARRTIAAIEALAGVRLAERA